MKNREKLIYNLKKIAGTIINKKYPHHTQLNLTADCVSEILKPKEEQKLNVKNDFKEYQNFTTKIRKLEQQKEKELNLLTDDELGNFNIPDVNDNFWK
jgi:hypothetical protein